MGPSDIKKCGQDGVHAGHHWNEPIRSHPMAAYGLSAGSAYDDGPKVRQWYCRGDTGEHRFRFRLTIAPEPGTPGPRNGDPFHYEGTLDQEFVVADVDARADAHQTALHSIVRSMAEAAVHAYHEAMIKEADELAGRPYLNEHARAQKRHEEWVERTTRAPQLQLWPEDTPEGQAQRRISEVVRRGNDQANWIPAQNPVRDPSRRDLVDGYDIRLCAYCAHSIVRIEPAPGYSEWTTDVGTTAGQECRQGPNRLHAPMAKPASGPQDTAY